MSSLVPFDFRCVGHLTGVSLRCAPLHLTLPASTLRPSRAHQQQPQQRRRRRDLQRTVAASAGPSPSSPLALRREDTTGHNSPEHLIASWGAAQNDVDSAVASVQGGSGERGSTPATVLAPPAVIAAAAGVADEGPSSHNHTRQTSSLLPPHVDPASDGSRTPSPHAGAVSDDEGGGDAGSGGTTVELEIDLHRPTLCLEMYFTLRVTAPLGTSSAVPEGAAMPIDKEAAGKENSPHSLAASAPLHTSEVSRGSAQPRWADLPPTCLAAHAAATHLDVAFFYTASCLSQAAALQSTAASPSSSPRVSADVCVHLCHVDMCDVVYAGASVEEADATLSRLLYVDTQPLPLSPQQDKGRAPSSPKRSPAAAPAPRGFTRPLVLLLCTDGVFLPRVSLTDFSASALALLEEIRAARTETFAPPPTAADLQMPSPTPSALHAIAGRSSVAATAASEIAAACTELPWSRAPSSVGWRYPPSSVPRAAARRISLGDVKAAALSTVAWQRLAELAEGRQAALADEFDAEAAADPAGRAQAARHAALRVQLAAAREQLTLSTLELEALQERVEERQRHLQRQEEAHALLQSHLTLTTSAEAQELARAAARDEEAQRARLRAQLARVRQQRARELCLVYHVELSNQYANLACTRAADAKDHINRCALPVLFAGRADTDTGSQLVARSADEMHEEAVALGHAGHLLVVLSSLYSCALPHPIVLGSGQSFVLASPTVGAAQAMTAPYTLTEARKYPLSCHRVGERPLMMGGVRLLLRDGVALARAMGKPERRVLACSDRLGALLDLLLRDAE